MSINLEEYGIELDAEKMGALTAAIEAAQTAKIEEATSGLKSKVDELLGETKTAKQKARESQEKLESEAIKRTGDIEQIEKHLQEQKLAELERIKEEYTSKIEQKDGLILGGVKNTTKAKLLSLSKDSESELVLDKLIDGMITTGYNEEGKPVATLHGLDGSAISTDTKAMQEYIQTSKAFAPLIRSKVGTGSGASSSQSTSGGGASAPETKQARIDAINAKFQSN